ALVSYPDGIQAPDGTIHILYDWNRHTDAEILLAKFREEDVLADVGHVSSVPSGKTDGHVGNVPHAKPALRILVNKAYSPRPPEQIVPRSQVDCSGRRRCEEGLFEHP